MNSSATRAHMDTNYKALRLWLETADVDSETAQERVDAARESGEITAEHADELDRVIEMGEG